MAFHGITPTEEALVMQTEGGHLVQVLAAPLSSLPPGAQPVLSTDANRM